MTSQLPIVLLLCAVAGACSSRDGPPLNVTEVVVAAPLPGASVVAAHMTIVNNSNRPITIERITSPHFARIEMHETIVQDDVARMRPLAPLTIERRSSMRFEPGGKHLMMSEWTDVIVAGQPITLEFHYDGGGLLIVSTNVATTVGPRGELQEYSR